MSVPPEFGSSRQPMSTACFSVHGLADPSAMSRVIEVFAKRGLVPDRWHSTVCGQNGRELQIDLQVVGLDSDLTERVAQSLRQLVCVESVLTSEKRSALSA